MDISQMKLLYTEAKKAIVGTEIKCPCCGIKFIKSTYNRIFCSNPKNGQYQTGLYNRIKRQNCKDDFWNKVDPEKRNRKQHPAHYDSF